MPIRSDGVRLRPDGLRVRHADPAADGAACAAIYAPAITDGVASFEELAPTGAEMAGRIERVSAQHPWLVAELDGEPVGFAYATRHRDRAAYRWTADTSVYVSANHHRRGIGTVLYGALMPLLVQQGLFAACAGITLPNDASVALHEQFGFELVGVYRDVGFKQGAWRSVGWWLAELQPRPAGGDQPPEPGPPARLPG